jgi:hypothetical protein
MKLLPQISREIVGQMLTMSVDILSIRLAMWPWF